MFTGQKQEIPVPLGCNLLRHLALTGTYFCRLRQGKILKLLLSGLSNHYHALLRLESYGGSSFTDQILHRGAEQ